MKVSFICVKWVLKALREEQKGNIRKQQLFLLSLKRFRFELNICITFHGRSKMNELMQITWDRIIEAIIAAFIPSERKYCEGRKLQFSLYWFYDDIKSSFELYIFKLDRIYFKQIMLKLIYVWFISKSIIIYIY